MSNDENISPGEVARRAMRETLVSELAKVDLGHLEIDRFLRSLLSESERAVAIIAHSYVEERMKDLFSDALNPEISGGVESLFGALGPLATAHSRVQMAAALYWLSRASYRNLNLLRKIRNKFAHDPFISGFDHQEISNLVNELTDYETPFVKELGLPPPTSLRLKYLARYSLIVGYMITEMASHPKAVRLGLQPEVIRELSYEQLPKSLTEVYEATAGFVQQLLTSPS
jgi:DNA-binding MltR family transcriptional regulator